MRMNWRVMAASALALVSAGALACEDTRCVAALVYPVDEDLYCLRPPRLIPELQACAASPPPRRPRLVCLVDSLGELHLASTSDSVSVSGTGWRYSGGMEAQALSA